MELPKTNTSLYKNSKGFVVHYQDDQSLVSFDDSHSSESLSHRIVRKDDSQFFLANIDGFKDEYKYNKNKPLSLKCGDVLFGYDTTTRELLCHANVNGVPETFRVPLVTKKQLWQDQNPGPYGTLRITIHGMTNPFEDVSYTYWNNGIMLSDPPQIDLQLPRSKFTEFQELASKGGYSAWNPFEKEEHFESLSPESQKKYKEDEKKRVQAKIREFKQRLANKKVIVP